MAYNQLQNLKSESRDILELVPSDFAGTLSQHQTVNGKCGGPLHSLTNRENAIVLYLAQVADQLTEHHQPSSSV